MKDLFWGILLIVGAVIFFADTSPGDDKERVHRILRDTAMYSSAAETAYSEALASIESVKAGKPLYVAAKEVKEQAELVDTHANLIARIGVEDCKEVTHKQAGEEIYKGVEAVFQVNKIRAGYLTEAARAMNQGSAENMQAVIVRYGDKLSSITTLSVQAVSSFVASKKAVGLPEDLSEFQ